MRKYTDYAWCVHLFKHRSGKNPVSLGFYALILITNCFEPYQLETITADKYIFKVINKNVKYKNKKHKKQKIRTLDHIDKYIT